MPATAEASSIHCPLCPITGPGRPADDQIPRSAGSSSTSCIGSSYDEKAVTGVAVRRSCGHRKIWSAGSKHHVWSAGSKHHVTALESSSQRSDCYAGSSPPRKTDVSGRPRFILPASRIPAQQVPRPAGHRSCGRPAVTAAAAHTHTTSPATARQRTPACDRGQPAQFSRRYHVSQRPATTVMHPGLLSPLQGWADV